jgi:hypothetical protein
MWGKGAEVLVWKGAMYLLDDLETIQVEPDR